MKQEAVKMEGKGVFQGCFLLKCMAYCHRVWIMEDVETQDNIVFLLLVPRSLYLSTIIGKFYLLRIDHHWPMQADLARSVRISDLDRARRLLHMCNLLRQLSNTRLLLRHSMALYATACQH